ncbi:MAG: hypothetical protein C0184_13980 [Chloroflexus aggregans]|uniref:Uncharacterized protein n=1 Tax=Chloroflexus aggregans TaxID=152260 RepID=A0A2J6WWI7_9CHLR|nr:MAG: hypothetical protein C0184_13980 [Chloroflexus aggregans]
MIGRNRVQSTSEAITLQYANGKSIARPVGGKRFSPYIGFHIEVGRDDELDTRLRAAQIDQIEIKHQRQGGAEIVRHWKLGETIRFYPITSGPVAQTVAGSLGRNAHATAAAGIGIRWGSNDRSRMAVRGHLDLLVQMEVMRLVQLSVRSRMSDVLLAALLDHGRVCESADHLIDRTKHPDIVTFHELALPLGPGEEEEWGKGETTTVVPFKSLHPSQIDQDYIRQIWRPDAVHQAALNEWPGIQVWASEYALQAEERNVSNNEPNPTTVF